MTCRAVVALGLELAVGCRVDDAREGLADADLAGATELEAEDLAFAFGVAVAEAPTVAAAPTDLVGVAVLVGFAARVGLLALVGVLVGVGVGVAALITGGAAPGFRCPEPPCQAHATEPFFGTLSVSTPCWE